MDSGVFSEVWSKVTQQDRHERVVELLEDYNGREGEEEEEGRSVQEGKKEEDDESQLSSSTSTSTSSCVIKKQRVRYETMLGILSNKVQQKTKLMAPKFTRDSKFMTVLTIEYIMGGVSLLELARRVHLEEHAKQGKHKQRSSMVVRSITQLASHSSNVPLENVTLPPCKLD
eukprot:TRINITY_DN4088_c0_g1_i2.p1 TRINITY_DN4088_c0_g1~~TRINITY_DN4088_c0_g1_i2.p1  ORF type:complete len:180 (+),score=54.39 TRINITY_DN4088_c0_g1_i2:25-540(+)